MRITTNAILRNYKSNLGTSLKNLDTARTRVMTQRKFNSTAEDPSNALRAAILERKYAKNNDYLNIVKDVQSFQDSQEDAAMQIETIAKELSKRYGKQILTYRGIDVNSDDPDDQAALAKLSKDTKYVDLGFGLNVDAEADGTINIDSSSAFNTSLPGINLAGFGKDDNGMTNNIVLLCGEIADILDAEEFDREAYKNLLNKFDEGRSNVLEKVTILGTQTEFLSTTKDRLETSKISLSTQIDNVVNVDMAEAIMDFSWAQYAYNAALKVGNNILTPSFIDFMN